LVCKAFRRYLLLRGKRLKDHIANYRTKRGMDFHHDVRDWLGGYPYESISSTELCRILEPLGFECIKQNVKRRSGLFGSGCDEYVFRAPMRFALFTTNLAGGGAEKALAKIGSGLAGRGHEVDFIVCEDGSSPANTRRPPVAASTP
jgi:hypothetical protein